MKPASDMSNTELFHELVKRGVSMDVFIGASRDALVTMVETSKPRKEWNVVFITEHNSKVERRFHVESYIPDYIAKMQREGYIYVSTDLCHD